MWKEATVAYFKILFQDISEGLKKTGRNLRTCDLWNLPSAKQEY
jgi:hypothetical protein